MSLFFGAHGFIENKNGCIEDIVAVYKTNCTPMYVIVFQNASAQAALQAAQALTGQNDTQGGPNTVLRVIVEHMIYPITLDVLYQVRNTADSDHLVFRLTIKTAFHS